MDGRRYVLDCAEAGDLKPLIFQLEETDNQLSREERVFLARYLRGYIKTKGRPKLSPRSVFEAKEILKMVLVHEAHGTKRDFAFDEVARTCNISRATVISRCTSLSDRQRSDVKAEVDKWKEVCGELEKQSQGDGERIYKNWAAKTLSGAGYFDFKV